MDPFFCGKSYSNGQHLVINADRSNIDEATFTVPVCTFGDLELEEPVSVELLQVKISGLLNIKRETLGFHQDDDFEQIIIPEGLYNTERLIEVLNNLCSPFLNFEEFQCVDCPKLRLKPSIVPSLAANSQMTMSRSLWRKLGFSEANATVNGTRVTIQLGQSIQALSAPNLNVALDEISINLESQVTESAATCGQNEATQCNVLGSVYVAPPRWKYMTANQCLTFTPLVSYSRKLPFQSAEGRLRITLTDSYGELVSLHPHFAMIEILMEFK